MKLRIFIALFTALSFSGCTNPSDLLSTPKAEKTYVHHDKAPVHKKKSFAQAQQAVGLSTKKDPKYKSFKPVMTDDNTRDWFNNNMYLLWDRQITRGEYVARGIAKFPSYKYEFTFIANQF